jgi:hypothetical protein
LIERGRVVRHLMDSDRVEQARLTPGAEAVGDKLHYPASQGDLGL